MNMVRMKNKMKMQHEPQDSVINGGGGVGERLRMRRLIVSEGKY